MKFLNRYFFAGVGTGCLLSLVLSVGATFLFGYLAMRKMGGLTEAADAGSSLRAPEFPPPDRPLTAFGEPDWDWTLHTLEGGPLTLGEFRGEVVFLHLWATWCGPCKRELPNLQALYDSLKAEGIRFIFVSREDPDAVRSFLEREPYDMPFYTRTGALPADLQSGVVPTTFIINPEGTVVFKETGARAWDDETSAAFLRRLLKEEG